MLEINWEDILIILNNKEVHLPTTLLIPSIHKLKVRQLFGKRDSMHVYIMLKQRKSWYNLECEQEYHSPMKKSPALLSQITFILAYFNFRMAFNK